MSSLKDKAIKGVMWSAIERFGNQGIQFVIGLVLARLLLPEDYGLIGMILVFISLAQVFVEGGFPAALIRKTNVNDSDYSTVFWFNMIASFVCYILLFFSSPFIAEFFKEPKLILLTQVVGLNIIINSFGIIQKTILTKNLNFKSQATVNLSSIMISGLIGVYCAYNEYGVWALVIQNLSRNVFMSVAFWISSSWRPKAIFSRSSFKELFGFGSNLLFSSLINASSENLYFIIIGKLYDAKSLGFYTRANQFQKLPVSSIYGAIGVVSYPVLSELQHDNQQLREGYRSMFKLVAFILFPIMAILGVVAEPLIKVVLTEKWLPSVYILQILCIEGALYPLQAINLDILKVKGRSDLFLKLEIIKQIVAAVVIIVAYRWGINGLVWGLIVLSCICYYINSFYSKIFLKYGIVDQLKDLSIFILSSMVMFSLLFSIKLLISSYLAQIILLPFLGLCIYILTSLIFKIDELSKVKLIFSSLFYRKKLDAK